MIRHPRAPIILPAATQRGLSTANVTMDITRIIRSAMVKLNLIFFSTGLPTSQGSGRLESLIALSLRFSLIFKENCARNAMKVVYRQISTLWEYKSWQIVSEKL